ncbi:MAG: S8 family serine peptidase [Bacteroidales bacterium]|nr:S8 family serine peptidase [Bacteroidales bacterium]
MALKSYILSVCLLASTMLLAQAPSGDYSIYFKTGPVVPEANTEAFIASLPVSAEDLYNDQFFKIIQFNAIPSDELKNQLNEAGITLISYLPQNAWFASFNQNFDATVLSRADIRSISSIETDYKLSPDLYPENFPEHAVMTNGSISILVSYFANLDPSQAVGALQAEGLPVIMRDDFGHYVNMAIPQDQIRKIAELPYVMFMEPVYPEPEPENYTGRTLHRTNAIATDYGAGRHYDGTGVIVELQDDGIIGPHIDYEGRIPAQFLSNNSGNHGDHCAGIIMAAGNVDPLGRGNAFGADLYVYAAAPNYPGFNAIPSDYGNLGVRITSTSYSNGCNAGYTALAQTMDQQVRAYPSLMHVFSAGNEGTGNCGYGAGAGWGNVTGGHKIAKNVIAVANLDYIDGLASSSSRGPAHDGRIKPDCAAKGSSVYSTVNPNDYALKSGTSMACPGVAGTLAQLYQAYKDNFSGADPMAGLIKGILLNTAEDLGNAGPDFKFGWGRVNALRAAQVIEEARFDSGSLSQGGTKTHTIAVPANVAQLRVMIYWTDYEATVNTTWALVNNLDMTLTDPASTTWLPWKLSHYPSPDSLNLPAFRGIDNRNNMEQVTLDAPAAGTYTIEVQGATVPQGPQTYYIIYEFISQDVVLTYPIGGEPLVPGESELIRWDDFGVSQTFKLESSMDNGQTWDLIAENIPGSYRYKIWMVPNTITGEALVRITKGSSVSQSEAPFTILGVPCNLKVDWACTGTTHLSWSPVSGALAYEVMKLGEKYMEVVGTTPGASFIVADTNVVTSSWFTVRAVGENGSTGRRAYALEKTPGNIECYPTDAMLVSVPSAQWGLFQTSLMDLSAAPVTLEVRNFGSQPIVGPTLKFQLDNNTEVTENYSGTIEPDSTILFTFSETIDIDASGTYTLKAWIYYPPDQYNGNNMLEIPIEVIDGMTVSFGYEQNFDSWQKCVSAPLCELIVCDLENGWYNMANDVYDQHDWRTYSGPTSTGLTGPAVDHTTGTYNGQYLYMEPSNFCLDKMALINTPCVDLRNGVAPTLTLWYHAWGAEMGEFHIDLFDGSDILSDIVTPIIGDQGNEWKEVEIDLSPWNGDVVALRLRGVTSCGQKGDFAIDDFAISDITAIDNGVNSVANRLKLYPNPASGEVTITLTGAGEESYLLQIIDLFGRTVNTQQLTVSGSNVKEIVNITSLPAGIYLVQLKGESEVYRVKLTVK